MTDLSTARAIKPALLKYALLAQSCYKDKPTYGVENSASRAVVYGDVVAIPGTNNIVCALADMTFDTMNCALGKVHEGFYQAYAEMRVALLRISPKVVVGHSLGGSMALIYGAELCLSGKPPDAIFAFEAAMPSVDSVLGDILRAHHVPVYITHHGHDIVPCEPSITGNWQMPAPVIELCETEFPYPNISWHVMENISDHLIENVILAIQAL